MPCRARRLRAQWSIYLSLPSRPPPAAPSLNLSSAVRTDLLVPRSGLLALGTVEYGYLAGCAIGQIHCFYLFVAIRAMHMCLLLILLFHDFFSPRAFCLLR